MNAGTWTAIVALLIALAALLYSRRTASAADRSASAADRSASAAEEQTGIQRQIRIGSAQPYVWADLRQDEQSGVMLNLVVGNSGPTVATNVRVKIDPPLPTIEQLKESAAAQQRLAEGISSIPPGRTLRWALGPGFTLLQADGPQQHNITITADGPFGPVPPLTYVVDLADWRGQLARPPGNIHPLTAAIEALTKKLK